MNKKPMFSYEEYDRVYQRTVDANVRIGELLAENKNLKQKASINDKLQYLDRLHSDKFKNADRIKRVCDSIEKDLGLSKPFKVGDLKVNIKIDVDDLIARLKEAMGKVPHTGGYVKASEEAAIEEPVYGRDTKTIQRG
ncbi:hypothetical protein [Bacillus sp. FJAT-26390]|uniref:hypothetical protein n=1 Tax=Bacillus sp. FJAT-26390 TaxID=1743142 RepID=UPI000807B5B0|nr:hypothetical protein [Bacillus sp. FJAT-26390]OBZ13347.1 hypothetical protein A7975_10860 [Bacillus sp. FJAT-26390]